MGLHQTDTNQELYNVGNSLGVRWLGLCTFTAKGPGSIPGQGTKILKAESCGWGEKKCSQLSYWEGVTTKAE